MPIEDRFASAHLETLESPYTRSVDVAPSDSVDLAFVTRAIAAAVAGVVKVDTKDGTTSTIPVAAGIPFKIRAKRIYATGTTATGIVALD